MNHPLAIANYFIERSLADGGPISLMKLVRLVYVAYGWRLGMYGTPLLTEVPVSLKYRPVTTSVYSCWRGVKYLDNKVWAGRYPDRVQILGNGKL